MLLKQIKQDKMYVEIYDTRTAMGQAAAQAGIAAIRLLLQQQESVNVIFAAAPSQNEVLAELAASDLEFKRINAFHLDEYLGLEPDAPQRFAHYLKEHIWGKVAFQKVHVMGAGRCEKPEQECRAYSNLLEQNPVDVSFIGIGENGHIAFNDPHVADFHDPHLVKVVELDDVCRMQQVHDGCFARIDQVPKQALTLTIPAILRAKHIICTVPGSAKSNAVKHTVYGEVAECCPATAMRYTDGCMLFCDEDSGSELLKEDNNETVYG